MDLSKAFDTLNHDLLIAKFGAYGFETDALRYMKSYLANRKQRVRVNVIVCVSGITHKTKHSYSITFLWKIAKNKKVSVL